jgi:hypothetical protein
LGQPNPDSYLRDLERNGFLKTIDTRSLYLNLFPFNPGSRKTQLEAILEQQGAFELLLSDAQMKAALLGKTGSVLLKGIVGKAIATVREHVNGDFKRASIKPSLRGLIGALYEFVDVHDKINDRVPAIGYQDDLQRLKHALAAID